MRGLYQRISPDEPGADDKEMSQHTAQSSLPTKWRSVLVILSIFLCFSLSANGIYIAQQFSLPSTRTELASRYAQLQRNVPKDIAAPLEYSDPNRTIQDAAWNDPSLLSWELYVALDDDYANSLDLPRSQRWPWDLTKGVYTITAGHELHCVRVIRSVLLNSYDGVPEADWSWAYHHAVHCLNVLRETVMCNADDRPLYVGRLHKNAHAPQHLPGNGMIRMCRDWDALMDWAHAHSACYLSVHRNDPNFNELDRYKYCPDGSRPWEAGVAA